MKNRKNLIIAFVIAALLVIGVGYAALEDSVTINGTVGTVQNKLDINVEQKSFTGTDGVTASTTGEDDTLTTTVEGLTAVGDTITITYTITHDSSEEDITAYLTYTPIAEDTTYFDYTFVQGADSLDYNGTTTMTLTVTLLKTIDVEDLSGTFTITVNATSEAPAVEPTGE